MKALLVLAVILEITLQAILYQSQLRLNCQIHSIETLKHNMLIRCIDKYANHAFIVKVDFNINNITDASQIQFYRSVIGYQQDKTQETIYAFYHYTEGIFLKEQDKNQQISIFGGSIQGQPIFGDNKDELFWIHNNEQQLNIYRYYKNKLSIIQLNQTYECPQFHRSKNKVYLSLYSSSSRIFKLYLIQPDRQQVTLQFTQKIRIIPNSLQVKIYKQKLLINYGNEIVGLNISQNYSKICSIKLKALQVIVDFILMQNNLIIMSSSNMVYQYNMMYCRLKNSKQSFGSNLTAINSTHFLIWAPGKQILYMYFIGQNSPNLAQQVINQIQQSSFAQNFGQLMTLASMKSIFKFFTPLNCFLEEYWLYKYHQVQYPQFFKSFMQEIDLINYLKLTPPFQIQLPEQFISQANQVNDKQRQASKNYQFDSIYFNRYLQTLVPNLVLNVLLFVILWVVIIIVYQFSKIFPKLKILKSALQRRSRIPQLWINIIESNILIFIFYAMVQCSHLFHFTAFTKFYFFIPFILMFVVIVFAIVGYFIIHWIKPSSIKNSLVIGNTSFRGYITEIVLMLVQKIIKACIHSLLIQSYCSQIIALVVVDICIVCFVFFYREYFMNTWYFIAIFGYQITIFVTNCLFLLRYQWLYNYQNMVDLCDNLIAVVLIMTTLFTVVKVVAIIFFEFKQFVCSLKCNTVEQNEQNCEQNQHGVIYIEAQLNNQTKVTLHEQTQQLAQYKHPNLQCFRQHKIAPKKLNNQQYCEIVLGKQLKIQKSPKPKLFESQQQIIVNLDQTIQGLIKKRIIRKKHPIDRYDF